MATFDGDETTTPASQFGPPNGVGATTAAPQPVFGSPGGSGSAVHYKLRAFRTSDSTWQYWLDVVPDLTNAPGGTINFAAASLTIEGQFKS